MEDWKAEADRLRAKGLSIRQIARRVGKGHAIVGEHFKPHYCACGNVRNHQHGQCQECRRAHDGQRHDRLVERVARMYNEGVLLRDIAEALGRSGGRHAVGQLTDEARRRGLIGYRHHAYENRAAA